MLNFYLFLLVHSEPFFSTMLLTASIESQAVPGLRFFSPSAVALRRGTPEPHPWLSGPVRLPARSPAGPGPGPDGGRAGLPPIFRQLGGTGRPGPGSGRLGPGPGHRLALRGFRRHARGGRLRGLPSLGRWAPPALFSPARVSQLSCLPCVGVFAALRISRGPAGAVGRRTRYPYAFARLAGSLVAP